MLEQQDMTNLESMMKRIVDDSVQASEERMKAHVADSVQASEERMKIHVASSIRGSEERMKAHVDDSVQASEERMKTHVASSIRGSEERMKTHVDDSIRDSEKRMKAHVAKTVHDSETLMLDEMERYSNANLKKIEKLERKMNLVYPFYQVTRMDSDHMNNLFSLYYKLQEKLESHDKILCDHRDKLDAHTEQLGQLTACYA